MRRISPCPGWTLGGVRNATRRRPEPSHHFQTYQICPVNNKPATMPLLCSALLCHDCRGRPAFMLLGLWMLPPPPAREASCVAPCALRQPSRKKFKGTKLSGRTRHGHLTGSLYPNFLRYEYKSMAWWVNSCPSHIQ